jgi:hypothetical protein
MFQNAVCVVSTRIASETDIHFQITFPIEISAREPSIYMVITKGETFQTFFPLE